MPDKLKKGALHKQLGIPMNKNIPVTLLAKIKHTSIGKTIKNPTKTGRKKYKITRLMKKRVQLVINFNYQYLNS